MQVEDPAPGLRALFALELTKKDRLGRSKRKTLILDADSFRYEPSEKTDNARRYEDIDEVVTLAGSTLVFMIKMHPKPGDPRGDPWTFTADTSADRERAVREITARQAEHAITVAERLHPREGAEVRRTQNCSIWSTSEFWGNSLGFCSGFSTRPLYDPGALSGPGPLLLGNP